MTQFIAKDALQASFIDRPLNEIWSMISPLYMVQEDDWIKQLIPMASPSETEKEGILNNASDLIKRMRLFAIN